MNEPANTDNSLTHEQRVAARQKDRPMPSTGGEFVRGKDGKLTDVTPKPEEATEAPAAEAPSGDAARPRRARQDAPAE